jgi:diguanylate cyclase (GGDEF)-like protein
MRNNQQVESGRYPGAGPVIDNGNRPRHPGSAHLAKGRLRIGGNSAPPNTGGFRAAATDDVIPVTSSAARPPPQSRQGFTSITLGGVGLFGLYLFWQFTALGGKARPAMGDVLFVLAGALVAHSAIHGRRVLQDERARNEVLRKELGRQALHDSLTGLANRTLFFERLQDALSRRRSSFMVDAVVVINLNGFKSVNESLGREAGDEVLKVVGERLNEVVRRSDTVARFGEDEFAILFKDISGEDSARALVEHILRIVRRPVMVAERELILEARIGVAVSAARPYSAQDLLCFAETAMCQAKRRGQSHYLLFEPAMQTALAARRQLEADLRGAVRRGELRVLYQPIVDLATQQTIAFEALVRWVHPHRGLLEPAAFVPLAEDVGLIHELDTWVLYQACLEASRWQHEDLHFSHIGVHVNLSPLQLREPDLVQTVVSALSVAKLGSHFLTLELLESGVVEDLEIAHASLSELKELGVRISVDDFGTGYSSLTHLRVLPIDELKIDRSFIAAMATSPQASTLVHSLIQLGADLGITTVAEGIETADELRHLQTGECLQGQGYLFSHPLDRDDLRAYLKSEGEWRATTPT